MLSLFNNGVTGSNTVILEPKKLYAFFVGIIPCE